MRCATTNFGSGGENRAPDKDREDEEGLGRDRRDEDSESRAQSDQKVAEARD